MYEIVFFCAKIISDIRINNKRDKMNQSPTLPEPSAELPKPKSKIKLWIVLIIVVLIAVGYFGWTYLGKSKTETITTPATTTTTPAIAPVSTADWKTYTNTNYGFSLKYPSTYNVKEESKNIIFKSPEQKNIALNALNVQINASMQEKEETWKLPLDEIVQKGIESKSIGIPQKITLSGKSAYEGVSKGLINEYLIISKNNDNLYELLFESGNNNTLAENKSALTETQKTMLSTFQFTK